VASAEGRRIEAQSGMRVWGGGVPTRGSGGSVVSSHSRVHGGALGVNAFWCILKTTERSFLHLYIDTFSSSNSVSCHT